MGWLWMFPLLLVFGIGFVVIKKSNHFLSSVVQLSCGQEIEKLQRPFPYVLIFGFCELADKLKEILESYQIDYEQIDHENLLDRSILYTHVIAVSENDLDNLMIARIARRMLDVSFPVAVCNQMENQKIFEDYGICYFYKKMVTAEEIIDLLFSQRKEQKSEKKTI